MIRTHQLTRRFGTLTAVDRLDLEVDERGVVGFLGPNGAGKTTTMRMLCGILPQTSGTAEICGIDVFEDPAAAKARVGWLPETPPLYPELRVGEYLRFVAEIRGVDRGRRLARVGEVMEQVGLGGWEDRLLGTLSRGYRQRVGLAQALVHDPDVLILDEPTSGLDPAQLVPIRKRIASLAQDRLVVLSTHVLDEVERLCSRVVLLHQGRLVGDGTVEELARRAGAGPWLELVVQQTDRDHSAALAGLEAVDSVERLEPGRYRLTGGPDAADAVARAAAEGSWGLLGLSPRAASLQDVFLGLVRGDR